MPLTVRIKLLLAGNSFITARNWSSGAQHAFEAMELAEGLDDPRLLAATIGPYATWRYATGQGFDPALGRRMAEMEPWTGQLRTLDLPEFDLANIEFLEGKTASAIARQRSLVERAEGDGDYSSLPFLLGNATLGDFLEGRSDVAWARIDRAARLSQATDQRVAEVHTLMCEAAARGSPRRRRSSDHGRKRSVRPHGHHVMEGGRVVHARRPRAARAQSRRRVGGPGVRRRGARSVPCATSRGVSAGDRRSPWKRWSRSGDMTKRSVVVTRLEEHARSHGSPRLIAEAVRARARLLAAAGDLDGADAAIGEAEAIHRRIEDPWELAHTLLAAGEIHRRARRRARARAALREALESFAFLGARLWARQAREQLARIDAAREQGGLTPTQRRVAELAASGLTNRQVADRLFMSAHTVEAHLSAIYRALDITSRSQLSAALSADATTPRDSAGQIPGFDTVIDPVTRGISLFACRADARRRVRRAHPATEVGANQWHRQPRPVGQSRRPQSTPSQRSARSSRPSWSQRPSPSQRSIRSGSGPSVEIRPISPALVESGAQWELQRRQQSGDVDPLTEAQREWERQRRLQSVS